MNLLASIFFFLFSFLPKNNTPTTGNVQGIWKGYYGTENVINEITISINLKNKAEIFGSNGDAILKLNGTYQLLGDSAIIISGMIPKSKSDKIILSGLLNPTANFISGDWDASDSQGGCFYLQKQLVKSNP